MRFTEFRATNILGLKKVHMIPAGVNVVVAPNGHGKTSFGRAISYFLTGETPSKEMNLDALVHQGAKSLDVQATFENGVTLRRHRTSTTGSQHINGTPAQLPSFNRKLQEILSTAPVAVSAAVAGGKLFDMELPELISFLSSISDAQFTPETIRAAFAEKFVEIAKRLDISFPESLDDFADAEKQAVEARQAAKRIKKKAEADFAAMPPLVETAGLVQARKIIAKRGNVKDSIVFAEETMKKLRKDRDEALAKIAAASGASAGERAAKIEAMKKQLKELKDELGMTTSLTPPEELKKAGHEVAVKLDLARQVLQSRTSEKAVDEARLAQIGKQIVGRAVRNVMRTEVDLDAANDRLQEMRLEMDAIQAELTDAIAAEKAAESQIERMRTHKSMSPCPAFPEYRCPVSTATFDELRAKHANGANAATAKANEVRSRLDALKKAHLEQIVLRDEIEEDLRLIQLYNEESEIATRLSEFEGKLEAAKLSVSNLEKEREKLLERYSAAKTQADRREEIIRKGKAIKVELEALEAQPAEEPTAVDPDAVKGLESRLSIGEETIVALRLIERRDAAAEAVKQSTQDVDDSDEFAKELGSKGVKRKLIAKAAAPFTSLVNTVLQALAPRLQVTIDIEAKHPIRINKGGDTVLPPVALSRSEQLRVSWAMQFSVAVLTGTKVIVCDDVDALDQEAEGGLLKLVSMCQDENVQVFLLKHSGPPEGLPAGAAVFLLENGSLTHTGVVDAQGNVGFGSRVEVEPAEQKTYTEESGDALGEALASDPDPLGDDVAF